MSDLLAPDDERFSRALDEAGGRRWADPAFPYRLAGDGTVVVSGSACIGVVLRSGYLKGQAGPIALLRDITLNQASPVEARALVSSAVSYAKDQGAVALVLGALSLPLQDLTVGWEGVPAFQSMRTIKSARIRPLLPRWEEQEYKIFRATQSDVPALSYLLDLYRRTLGFAPSTDEEAFRAGIASCPGLEVADFRIARYKGEMVAMVGVWEPGAALPISDRGGASLRIRFVRAMAIKSGHQIALKYLLDRIANETRRAKAHAFEIAMGHDDALWDAVHGRIRSTRTATIWAAALDPDLDLATVGPADPGILDPVF